MSCSHHVLNGWLPALAMVSPSSATTPITAPRRPHQLPAARRRLARARPHLDDALVQLGLHVDVARERLLHDAADVALQGARLGSTIWYSSSTPSVSDGGFICAPLSFCVVPRAELGGRARARPVAAG
jgi:hypothetical protein